MVKLKFSLSLNLSKDLFEKLQVANSADPDQTALYEQSDLGLHCLL